MPRAPAFYSVNEAKKAAAHRVYHNNDACPLSHAVSIRSWPSLPHSSDPAPTSNTKKEIGPAVGQDRPTRIRRAARAPNRQRI
jgi:hypothetical protein